MTNQQSKIEGTTETNANAVQTSNRVISRTTLIAAIVVLAAVAVIIILATR